MKKFTFKGVLDGFRSSVQAAPRGPDQEIQETLRPDHFQIRKKPDVVKTFLRLMKAGVLPRGEVFTHTNMKQRDQVVKMFHLLYFAKDFDTFVRTACYLRERINAGMFVYALTVAALHRDDCRSIALPAPYEIYPFYFVDADVIHKAQMMKMKQSDADSRLMDYYNIMTMKESNSVVIDSRRSFRHVLSEHDALSYFTEDIDLNTYHYYFHMEYPAWMLDDVFGVNKERRGEMYLYLMQQLLARYRLERLSYDKCDIKMLMWDLPLETGYWPKIVLENGEHMPVRVNNMMIVNENNIRVKKLVDGMENFIRDAIMRGSIEHTFRHGFPYSPTALAWDPVQKLLAVGDKSGNLRMFRLGGPGVDAHARHESGEAVLHMRFMVNEGGLLTATADDHLHLWAFKQKLPRLIHSIKFQKERITCLHLPPQSRWLHVGTERGNLHVVHVDSFQLSGYVVHWNKAIELTRQNHPGAVVEISENPQDASKLLIAYESGLVVIWDLRGRLAEWRGCAGSGVSGSGDGVRAAVWQNDGKMLTAHADGALLTWTARSNRPLSVLYPHAKTNKDGKLEQCKPIHKLEWKTSKTGETFVIFSGGLPTDKAGRTHSITVLNGKSTTVLEMEHAVVDFVTLCDTPWNTECQDPYAIVVLLQHDLVVVDLLTAGYPCVENPHPMDLHEAPVTCCAYFADCPSDLIPAFYSVGRQGNKKRTGFSERLWPVDGGEWSPASCSYSEIILTGHADGSIKFWDASAGTLQILYKLKCSKVFERRGGPEPTEESPLAVQQLALCAESRRLAVSLPAGHVVLFKFRKQETCAEVAVIDVPDVDCGDEEAEALVCGAGTGAVGGELRVRGATGTGGVRRAPGFQPALVCMQQGTPHTLSALTINSSYGLLAWGGERGLVVVDVTRRELLAALSVSGLHTPPAPAAPAPPAARQQSRSERQRSPSLDQLEDAAPLPSTSPPDVARGPSDDPGPPDERTEPETRRKSSSWKTFNLKRQLSRVDLKLKAAFAVPPEPPPARQPSPPDPVEVSSPPPPPLSPPDELDDDPGSPARRCAAAFERMHRELRERAERGERGERGEDVYDRMHQELRERWREDGAGAGGAARPDHLPLGESPPEPPPRRRGPRGERPPGTSRARQGSLAGSIMRRLKPPAVPVLVRAESSVAGLPDDKLDSSFSRSRSSSMSSLENIAQEAVQCLAFADSYTKKSEPTAASPTLWVGTTLGAVVPLTVTLPEPALRASRAPGLSAGGAVLRLKGAVLALSFLDCNGALIPYSYERDRTPTRQGARTSPTPAELAADRQFVVVASEKQARVVALPSQNCVHRQRVVDVDFVVKAEIVSLKDSVCLVNYLSTGHLVAYSLPSLRPLIDVDFLPLSELSFQTQTKQRGIVDPMLSIWGQQLIVNEDTDQIARTFCFSNRGHGLYLASPTEIQKFTIDAEFCCQLSEMVGEVFLPRDMPEPPKESFFRGLFGGGARPLDREELFGESRGSRAVARPPAAPVPSPAALDQLGARASTASSEISRAHLMALERGDKLSQLEDRTERMHSQAAEFGSSAHQLMLKYKDKKWYQL